MRGGNENSSTPVWQKGRSPVGGTGVEQPLCTKQTGETLQKLPTAGSGLTLGYCGRSRSAGTSP